MGVQVISTLQGFEAITEYAVGKNVIRVSLDADQVIQEGRAPPPFASTGFEKTPDVVVQSEVLHAFKAMLLLFA